MGGGEGSKDSCFVLSFLRQLSEQYNMELLGTMICFSQTVQKFRKLAAMRSSSSSFLGEALSCLAAAAERLVKTADFDLEWRGVGLLGCVGARWCCVAAIWGNGGVRAYTEELRENRNGSCALLEPGRQ